MEKTGISNIATLDIHMVFKIGCSFEKILDSVSNAIEIAKYNKIVYGNRFFFFWKDKYSDSNNKVNATLIFQL